MIGAVDGLPGPDLTQHIVTNGIYEQDFVVYALMVLLVWEIHSYRLWSFFSRGLGKALLMFAVLNVAWWVLTLYRTSWIFGIHINHAANFGRAFLYIAILTPLFAAGMQRRDTRNALFVVAGAWSLVISGASILGSIHQSSFTLQLLHVTTVKQTGTLTRLYVHAEDLLVVALMFAIPFLLASTKKAQRWFAALVAIFAVVAVGVLQTRASYYGCIGGALVAALVYMSGADSRASIKRLMVVFATLAVVIAGIFVFASGSGIAKGINEVTYRAASAIGAVNSSNTYTSTVAERSYELHLLEQRLGGQYVLGLGFIRPAGPAGHQPPLQQHLQLRRWRVQRGHHDGGGRGGALLPVAGCHSRDAGPEVQDFAGGAQALRAGGAGRMRADHDHIGHAGELLCRDRDLYRCSGDRRRRCGHPGGLSA